MPHEPAEALSLRQERDALVARHRGDNQKTTGDPEKSFQATIDAENVLAEKCRRLERAYYGICGWPMPSYKA